MMQGASYAKFIRLHLQRTKRLCAVYYILSRIGQFDALGYIRFLRKAPCCICDLNSSMRLRLYPLEYFPPGHNSGHIAAYRFKVLGDMLYKRLQAASESIISSSCILTPTICANLTAKFFANSPLDSTSAMALTSA